MAQREIILITGANTGIGFQIVRALCSSDKAYDILIGGRSPVKVQEAIKSATAEFPSSSSKLFPLQVDIEYDDAINRAFGEVQSKFGRVDALINNAGAQIDQQLSAGTMTEREMWNQSWNVNTAGSQVMTSTFVPLLLQAPNPRLLFITSGTATLAGTENMALFVNKYSPKGWPKGNFDGKSYNVPAYRSSKTGMNMMMREWHRILHEDRVKVWCISPGYLATGLGGGEEANRKMGAGDPSVAGGFIRSVLEGARDDDVGKVILKDGVQPW
uniref:Putative short-chain dehydrogenase/reductase n=1 Tax=Cladonia uncialis subsp. uncialis TaxID=180999 RepID=A0A1Z1CC35_CLAUC|nr:putative short-chain dehydrogenase/reductase [Cladonia uncialis subsp. uncialis]AUW31044.1 putative short-chain dehydrogenase/reductase [Cladonia uncialis subsp. uncialis]